MLNAMVMISPIGRGTVSRIEHKGRRRRRKEREMEERLRSQ